MVSSFITYVSNVWILIVTTCLQQITSSTSGIYSYRCHKIKTILQWFYCLYEIQNYKFWVYQWSLAGSWWRIERESMQRNNYKIKGEKCVLYLKAMTKTIQDSLCHKLVHHPFPIHAFYMEWHFPPKIPVSGCTPQMRQIMIHCFSDKYKCMHLITRVYSTLKILHIKPMFSGIFQKFYL